MCYLWCVNLGPVNWMKRKYFFFSSLQSSHKYVSDSLQYSTNTIGTLLTHHATEADSILSCLLQLPPPRRNKSKLVRRSGLANTCKSVLLHQLLRCPTNCKASMCPSLMPAWRNRNHRVRKEGSGPKFIPRIQQKWHNICQLGNIELQERIGNLIKIHSHGL